MTYSFVSLVTLAAPAGGTEISIMKLIADASPVVKAVLLLLVLMSVVSWYIIAFKFIALKRANRESELFLETFWQSKRLDEIYQTSEHLKRSPISQVFRAGYIELTKLTGNRETGDTMIGKMDDIENIERALRRARTAEIIQLGSLTPFLATTASVAPFVGLFGTVWGIMDSFLNIARKGDASLLTVAPRHRRGPHRHRHRPGGGHPRGHLLQSTSWPRRACWKSDMENFSNDFLNIVKRHFF
jgi:biopolymer transport protein TolQ